MRAAAVGTLEGEEMEDAEKALSEFLRARELGAWQFGDSGKVLLRST